MKIIRATKKHLTKRQKQVLDFVVNYLASNGYAPTEQEIADYFGRDRSTAQKQVEALVKKDYLRRGQKREWRNLEVISTG